MLNRYSPLTEIELFPGEGLKVTLLSEGQKVVLWINQLELPKGDGALALRLEGTLYKRDEDSYVLTGNGLPEEIAFLTVANDARSGVRLEKVKQFGICDTKKF